MLEKQGFFHRRDEPIFDPAASEQVEGQPASKPVETKQAKLVVGPHIKMRVAAVSKRGSLVVEGRMEAAAGSQTLEVAEHGLFQGTIAVDNAEIYGSFEGELTVRQQLNVYGTGKLSGKIRYARVRIEEGAELTGEVSMLRK